MVQHAKLSLVKDCMKISMTIGEVDCKVQVLENELTCRIPKDLVIPSEGLAVQVKTPPHRPHLSAMLYPHATELLYPIVYRYVSFCAR